jgi:hypothetical protein
MQPQCNDTYAVEEDSEAATAVVKKLEHAKLLCSWYKAFADASRGIIHTHASFRGPELTLVEAWGLGGIPRVLGGSDSTPVHGTNRETSGTLGITDAPERVECENTREMLLSMYRKSQPPVPVVDPNTEFRPEMIAALTRPILSKREVCKRKRNTPVSYWDAK